MAETLTIEARRKGGKSWRVECLGLVTADAYWSAPSGKAYRPAYLCIAERDEIVRGFIAHLTAGRPAVLRSRHGHEEPRQVEHHASLEWAEPQRTSGGITIATAYLPELCRLDPGRMPERIRFLFAPSTAWVEAQLASPLIADLGPDRELQVDAAVGSLFAAFVGTRTAWPVVPDPRFHARLWRAAQGQDLCVAPSGSPGYPGGLWCYPAKGPAGIPSAVVMDCGHAEWEALLRTETRAFLEAEGTGRLEERAWHATAPIATASATTAGTAAEAAGLPPTGTTTSRSTSVGPAEATAAGSVPTESAPATSPPRAIKPESTVPRDLLKEAPFVPSREPAWQPSLFD